MTVPEHIRLLREHAGHELILVSAVAAFVRRADGALLVVRQREETRWALPGGLVELGEAPADALVRETREECGVEVEPVSVLGVFGGPKFRRTYPNGDRIESFEIVFECRVLRDATALADGEIVQSDFRVPSELHDWMYPIPVETLCEAADQRRTLVQVAGMLRLLGA